MLESAGVLRTWRLVRAPAAREPIAAEAIGDHRVAYLDYEGPLSGGRGTVVAWDRGDFEWLANSTLLIRVRFVGSRVNGIAVLRRQDGNDWLFEWE